MKKYLILLFLFSLFTGCDVGPNYHPPESPTPSAWKNQSQIMVNGVFADYWWEVFEDPWLTYLEEQAISNNYDLHAAIDRVMEARALTGIAGADLYPQLNLSPVYNNQDSLYELFGTSPLEIIRAHMLLYTLPINLNYEVDLWGKIRNQYRSAFYNYQAQIEAYHTALLILTADLAAAYFQLRTLDLQIETYLATIQSFKQAYEINKARYDGLIVNYSDVTRASIELTNAEADYWEAVRQRALQEDRIAVLIGVPASEFTLEAMPLRGDPPLIPAGIPADILRQRPDIAEAERHMASEHALIKVAVADFLPSLQLTGILGYSSPELKYFLKWKSRWWDYGANANQTLFDGFRKESALDLSIAQFNEASNSYQQTVVIAFQEVEDSLANIEYYANQMEKVLATVEAAKLTVQISKDRYYRGVAFYLEVTDSEQQELVSERSYNALRGLRYMATIQLIKALGGSWTN